MERKRGSSWQSALVYINRKKPGEGKKKGKTRPHQKSVFCSGSHRGGHEGRRKGKRGRAEYLTPPMPPEEAKGEGKGGKEGGHRSISSPFEMLPPVQLEKGRKARGGKKGRRGAGPFILCSPETGANKRKREKDAILVISISFPR